MQQRRYKVKRVRQSSKPKASRPKELWGIDMTKSMITTVGWCYLVLVVDWYMKKIVGWKESLGGEDEGMERGHGEGAFQGISRRGSRARVEINQ